MNKNNNKIMNNSVSRNYFKNIMTHENKFMKKSLISVKIIHFNRYSICLKILN